MKGKNISRRAAIKGAAAAVAVSQMGGVALAARPAPIVSTRGGKLRGFVGGDVEHYLGIPYGAPTGGANRFKAPQKPAAWTGVRDALEHGPISPQSPSTKAPVRNGALAGLGAPRKAGEGEDCLNVNVWTPASGSEKRPVMVWLHGGAFATGSGSMDVYDGAALSKRGNVVVVNVTHRLNILGYAYLGPLLGADYADSGVVGMLDIVMALQWVRDNISAFGGDPKHVTIFGESGGGGKVSTLLAMPSAKGLFSKAIIQSGASIYLSTTDEAERVTNDFLSSMGLKTDDAQALLTMPVQRLVDGMLRFTSMQPNNLLSFAPVAGTRWIPDQPCYPTSPDCSRDVPLMLGSNLTESAFMYMGAPAIFDMDEAAMMNRLSVIMGTADIKAALAMYRRHHPNATPGTLFMLINTDRSMRKNTWRMADARAAQSGAPTYLYHFRFETPVMEGKLKSPHFLEVPLVFQNQNLAPIQLFSGGGARVDKMADVMSDAWITFARTGKPSGASLPDWKPYSHPDRAAMILNETSAMALNLDADIRHFWETHDYQTI
jgi:para-nitrobenzyl esterase